MMRLLLDTHVALWLASNTRRVPPAVRKLVENPRNDVFVAVASVIEIVVKTARGPLRGLPFSGAMAVEAFTTLEFEFLNVMPHHALALDGLAIAHSDPFDRLILAQAIAEEMRLVTQDARLASYSDTAVTW